MDLPVTVILSSLLALILFRPVHRFYKRMRLVDTPDWRKVDFNAVPLGGGFLLMLGLVMAILLLLLIPNYELSTAMFLLVLVTLLIFILGTIDDSITVGPTIKLLVVASLSLLFISFTGFRIMTFHGLFNVYELDYFMSYGLSVLVLVVFVNMFNLIDGIDGLASGIGVVTLVFLVATFEMVSLYEWSLLGGAVMGVLLVLFVNNHKEHKMYLGDGGSLALGFILGAFVLFILSQVEPVFDRVDYVLHGPVFMLTLFWYPLLDLLRVFVLRLAGGGSPLRADRRHFHHLLVDRGLSHLLASTIIILLTLALIFLALFLASFLGVNELFFAILFITLLVSYMVFVLPSKRV
ncbi:undecaprenyl/decaprenyl-phosphate alpha-N-acetylglucosaminyl 1-phosphate transferase [Winogradskyella sp.]|nr:undecaprenyl/decaprenyl-phosphate alpha-N-acetylglucosaminyl 1-phosphate transferase [Winogradskyella sp.]